MKIAFVSTYDARDVSNWSGTPYFMAKTLEMLGHELQYIDHPYARPTWLQRIKRRLYPVFGKVYDLDRAPNILKQYAEDIKNRMDDDVDVLFSPSTQPLTYCHFKPTVFYTDATFEGMLNYYDIFSNLAPETIKAGIKSEQDAIDNASLCIFSSQWAADTAVKYYHADHKKLRVISYGANVDNRLTYDNIQDIIRKKDSNVCKLLFMGVYWERKGGPKALEVVRYLNEHGFKAELHITGINHIPEDALPPYVINHGFISKATDAGKAKINQLLQTSHFLLLPTIADCTPIVYAEANSFGLPCLSTNTGGVPSIIKNGINGQLFELDAAPQAYLDFLRQWFLNKDNYHKFATNAYQEYHKRLNWDNCAKEITHELENILRFK